MALAGSHEAGSTRSKGACGSSRHHFVIAQLRNCTVFVRSTCVQVLRVGHSNSYSYSPYDSAAAGLYLFHAMNERMFFQRRTAWSCSRGWCTRRRATATPDGATSSVAAGAVLLQRRRRLPLPSPGVLVRPSAACFRAVGATAGAGAGPRLAWYSQCTHPIHPSCT